MRKICLCLLLALVSIAVPKSYGQQVATKGSVGNGAIQGSSYGMDWGGLRCSGEVPADLRRSMEELYAQDKRRVRDYTGGQLRNREKVLLSSYYISRLMASGKILFGDEVSVMLNRIMDTLMKDYPELRRELRVYAVKSSEVNAFATGQGMIFVNLGLVAQVEDEAQLAFVLSHEVIHYVRKHNLEVLTRKKKNRDTEYGGLNDFLRYHSRSREMESEADSLGIAMFYGNSPYDKRVTEGFFDVLQYGYLPFDEVAFDTTMFNTQYFSVTPGAWLNKVNPISAREDYNDSLSTHPNLLKRRLATTRQLSSLSGGRRYVMTTEKEFERLRTLARMECIRQDLVTAEYASAYYNCNVMLAEDPSNEYLHLAKAQALYGASKYRTYAAASSTSDYRNKEGEIQQVYHLMRRMKPAELCMIAVRETWKAKMQWPQEERFSVMVSDLMSDLYNKNGYKIDQFSATFDTIGNVDAGEDSLATGNMKYANVKRRRRQQQAKEVYRHVFTDLMEKDGEFEKVLKESMQSQSNENAPNVTDKGAFLFAPTYYVVNERNSDLKIMKSMSGESDLAGDIEAVNSSEGIKTVDFTDDAMRHNGESCFYNDFLTLCEWSNEFWQSHGRVRMKYSSQPAMNDLMKRYNADKLALGSVVNIENTKGNITPFYSALFIAFLFPAPEVIYYNLVNHQQTMVDYELVDTRNGSLLAGGKTTNDRHADTRAYVRSQTNAIMTEGLHPGKAPGYMGKRFIVEGLGGLSFPLLNRPFREKTDFLATRFGGGIEFVVGRQGSLHFGVDHGKTTFDINHEPLSEASINTFNLNYRHSFGDNVAPLGPYVGVGGVLSKVQLQPIDAGVGLNYLQQEYLRPALQLEFGHNTIIKDLIVLNFGVKYNFTVAMPIEDMDAEFAWMPDYSKNARRSMNANLWMYNLISLHIGIGLIPF